MGKALRILNKIESYMEKSSEIANHLIETEESNLIKIRDEMKNFVISFSTLCIEPFQMLAIDINKKDYRGGKEGIKFLRKKLTEAKRLLQKFETEI